MVSAGSKHDVDSSPVTVSIQDESLPSSPVKTSHSELIDLTASSSDEYDGCSSEAEVVKLIHQSSPPASSEQRMTRLIKGTRPPETPSRSSTLDDCIHNAQPGQVKRDWTSSDGTKDAGVTYTPKKPTATLRSVHVSSDSENAEFQQHVPTLHSRAKHKQSRNPRTPSPELGSLSPPPLETPQVSSPAKKGKTPRVSKKATQAAEQARRESYARQLFNELNTSVFKGELPENTVLKWSNRLLTTAGRARWKRYGILLFM